MEDFLSPYNIIESLLRGKVAICKSTRPGHPDMQYRITRDRDGLEYRSHEKYCDRWGTGTGFQLDYVLKMVSASEADELFNPKPKTVTIPLAEITALKTRIEELEKLGK